MNEEALKLTLSSSPHAHSPNSTRRIMLDVCIALLPALIGAIVFFGARALTLTALSVAGCVFFEWAYRRIMKKDNTTGDLSAVVTGILVAFVCPVTLPFWTILIGDFFAIVVVKQLFGGIGANIVNPALAARAFLFSWPLFMNTWVRSGVHVPAFSNPTTASLDGLTAATPMASLHVGAMPEASVLDLFLGRTGGSLGEVSAMLLLLGGIYLLVRRVISARIPLAYLGTVAVLAFLFPRGGAARLDWMLVQLLSGGLMLGAIFMATDYATSPVTKPGQIIFGIGCGLLLHESATTGGTEMAARLLKLKFQGLSIGSLCLGLDVAVTIGYALCFRDMTRAMYGVVALYILSLLIDRVVYGPNASKVAYIISEQYEAITHELLQLDRGVTLLAGKGAWSGREKRIILCAFGRRHFIPIKKLVQSIDPDAFVIVCDAHEVLGEGFGQYDPTGL